MPELSKVVDTDDIYLAVCRLYEFVQLASVLDRLLCNDLLLFHVFLFID